MKNESKQKYLTLLSEKVLPELKVLIEERDKMRLALERLEKALSSEEALVSKLGEEIPALDKQILNLLGTGAPTAKETQVLRKLKEDLEESQARVTGLRAGIEVRKEGLYHLEHALLVDLQGKVQGVKAEAQRDLDLEVAGLVGKMESFSDAISDLCQVLGFLNILGTGERYRNKAGQIEAAVYSDEKAFLLDPRTEALDAYLLRLGCCWRNLG